MSLQITKRVSFPLFLLIAVLSFPALAEPYLAVRSGQKCMSCHVNPTGGGKRSEAGASFGQFVMPKEAAEDLWNGRVNPYLAVGGNLRANLSYLDRENADSQTSFETQRISLYLEITAVKDLLTFYVDQLMTPTSSNREAFALMWNEERSGYLKAGRIFLPYGLRLEDDTAFIRRVSGISFANADNGIEAGYETDAWSHTVALSNGSNGGDENNRGKQLSLRTEYLQPSWRLGASLNLNDGDDSADRGMFNVFAGYQWLGIDWLVEVDAIEDRDTALGDIEQLVGLLEANRPLSKGQNLKVTLEYYDPDTDVSENQQTRTSLVWEHTPVSLLQLRVGLRVAEGIPQAADDQNDDLMFVQLHSWF